MTTSLLTPARLEGVALVIAVAGVALAFLPVTPTVQMHTRAAPQAPAAPPLTVHADSVGALIVQTNLFSGSRQAPRERFHLPGQEPAPSTIGALGGTSLGTTPGDPSGMPMAGDGSPPVGPRVFGIVMMDGPPRALVQIAADSVARLVGQGERIGPWRVLRIDADRVVLTSSSGIRTVRLSRRPLSDSAGRLP